MLLMLINVDKQNLVLNGLNFSLIVFVQTEDKDNNINKQNMCKLATTDNYLISFTH